MMSRRIALPLIAAFAALVVSGFVPFAGGQRTAAAHPLGNFTVNRYSRVELAAGRVDVRYVIDMAEIPAFQEIQALDADHDGRVSEAESAAYVGRRLPELARNLELRVNGVRVALGADPAEASLTFPEGQGGLKTLRLVADFSGLLPDGWQGGVSASYRDGNYADRIGWKEIIVAAGAGVALTNSTAPAADQSAELTAYPDGLLKSPLDVTQAAFTLAAGSTTAADTTPPPARAARTSASQAKGLSGFAKLVEHRKLTPAFVALSLLAAMAWGAAHALGPGHGKTIVGAYLVGSRGTARHAVALGLTVTATHTAAVFALGLATLYASSFVNAQDLYVWLSVASGALVVLMGAGLLWSRWRAAVRGTPSAHHDHHHHSGGHEHAGGTAGDHDHSHAPAAPGWRGLVLLGISGGLLPCPTALVVMLGAIALDRVVYGMVLIVAFSAGLAGVLTGIGLVLVLAGRLVGENEPGSRFAFLRSNSMTLRALRFAPVVSAVVILAVGVVLTGQALAAL
jgi:nickel/cobalt exporter